MNISLRDPNVVMKLSRLGSFHQSKLSFLRSFIREFKDWNYKRNVFELNEKGHGVAVYSFEKNKTKLEETVKGKILDQIFDYSKKGIICSSLRENYL